MFEGNSDPIMDSPLAEVETERGCECKCVAPEVSLLGPKQLIILFTYTASNTVPVLLQHILSCVSL